MNLIRQSELDEKKIFRQGEIISEQRETITFLQDKILRLEGDLIELKSNK